MPRSKRPSPSMIVAIVALVAALAGTAAALPGKGSVTNDDLKKGAVTKKAIKKGAVTKKALKRGAVTGKAIAPGAVGAAAIAPGAVGTAAIADHAVSAAKLTAAESLHVIGTAGQPVFDNGGDGDCLYTDAGSAIPGTDIEPVGFYKDPYNRVYLSGIVNQAEAAGGDGDCGDTSVTDSSRDQVFFILPPAYRPAQAVVRAFAGGATIINGPAPLTLSPGTVALPPGAVAMSSNPGDSVPLSGVDFRAAGSAARAASTSPVTLPPELAKQFAP